jgi:hypothetical protein
MPFCSGISEDNFRATRCKCPRKWLIKFWLGGTKPAKMPAMPIHLTTREKSQRHAIAQALKGLGGDPSEAIPCTTKGGSPLWAAPLRGGEQNRVATCDPEGRQVRTLRAACVHIENRPVQEKDFPEATAQEDHQMEMVAAQATNGCAVHNLAPFLAWHRQTTTNLRGILTPAERRAEQKERAHFEQSIRRMAGQG